MTWYFLVSKDSKPFWRYVKSKCQDDISVAPLKSGDNLHSNSRYKATLLNEQFKSVFTPPQDKHSDIPYLYGPAYPPIKPLTISNDRFQNFFIESECEKGVRTPQYFLPYSPWIIHGTSPCTYCHIHPVYLIGWSAHRLNPGHCYPYL